MERKVLSGISKFMLSIMSLSKQTALLISVLFAILLSAAYIGLNWSTFSFSSNHFFEEFIDPVINILTFLTALLIGFYNLYINWKNSIEKRLTVFYIFYFESIKHITESMKDLPAKTQEKKLKDIEFIEKNHLKEKTSYTVMICDEALLAHEGDIRNWAFQLGKQLAKGDLDLHPFFKLGENNDVVKISLATKAYFTKQYMLYIFLESIPGNVIEVNAGQLSTENYDDSPLSRIKNFKVKEIQQNKVFHYQEMRDYINSLDTITQIEDDNNSDA